MWCCVRFQSTISSVHFPSSLIHSFIKTTEDEENSIDRTHQQSSPNDRKKAGSEQSFSPSPPMVFSKTHSKNYISRVLGKPSNGKNKICDAKLLCSFKSLHAHDEMDWVTCDGWHGARDMTCWMSCSACITCCALPNEFSNLSAQTSPLSISLTQDYAVGWMINVYRLASEWMNDIGLYCR